MTQCYPVLNADYFVNLIAQIEKANDEATLQALVNKEFEAMAYILSTLTSQVDFLNLVATVPDDLPSVITWITNFITQLTGPLAKLAAQATALSAQVAAVTAAINAIAGVKGWTITIPSVGIICTL